MVLFCETSLQDITHYEEVKILPCYQPGNLKQDIYTIPIEAGLILSLNMFYTPRSKTLFPILDEQTNLENGNATFSFSRSKMIPFLVGTGAGVFGGLKYFNSNFHFWTQVRGFTHAILISEVFDSAAKVIFQKKRPDFNFENKNSQGLDGDNSRASFYSDHSNMAFSFATYTTLLMFQYSPSILVSSVYGLSIYTLSGLAAYSRVQAHAHNFSDVLFGAIMGTSLSALIFYRVQSVDKQGQLLSKLGIQDVDVQPNISFNSQNNAIFGANLTLELL